MFELKVFQSESAALIADRYAFFSSHPDRPWKGKKSPRPFFQALSALTGAGKTPILAEAVSRIRTHLESEPIVFWMSKSKTVVAQTYNNFSSGGKYRSLIEEFVVTNISGISPQLIEDSSNPLIILATTGLFNNKEQADGALNIYKKDADLFGEDSAWERLISRSADGKKRPLIIVYDEGHNLSEQQAEILSELEPDAYLLASATLKLPQSFHKSVISHITNWFSDIKDTEILLALKAINKNSQPDAHCFITTSVDSAKVVNAQLVKKAIQFDGTTAEMEKCLDDLTDRLSLLEKEIISRKLDFKPKAIYVCKTNINDDGDKDDPAKPFEMRKAPPIKIWRYLVEVKSVDPKNIAIYANLNFESSTKPSNLNLFSKKESDFDDFSNGDYQHIIFNLSLQEGWDDPACYLAYIDKSMGSSIQVEQIIGRVLRQYGAQHYESPLLNSAHFFLRVDNERVFSEAINGVKTKLQSEGAPIDIVNYFSLKDSPIEDLEPKYPEEIKLHHIYVESDSARKVIAKIIEDFPNYVENSSDTTGVAHRASKVLNLDSLTSDVDDLDWIPQGNTNPVRLRWLLTSAIKTRSTRVLSVVDLKSKKFDVKVQVQSAAARNVEKLASEIVSAYYKHSDLFYETLNDFQFGVIRTPVDSPEFRNALYQRYHGLNKFEFLFAECLDESGLTWHRNPSSGGYHIPLLSEGDTSAFFPDFIVWEKNNIYCLDTKGSHLLTDAVARKLFDIKDHDDRVSLKVRFITEGKQTELRGKTLKGGYTVWKSKSGSPIAIHVDSLSDAVAECVK